jgi:hypothetical protein
MKRMSKISILITIFLGNMVFCMAQDDETSRMVLNSITKALLENDCDKAQRNYNIWKELTGKTNSDIEGEIGNCKTSGDKDYIELQNANIAVQTTDIGNKISYETAKLMCKNSITGGFTDWRLPDENELMMLFIERNSIKNFGDDLYWVGDTPVRYIPPLRGFALLFSRTIKGKEYNIFPIENGYVYSEYKTKPTIYNAKKISSFPPDDKSILKTNTAYYYRKYAILEGGSYGFYFGDTERLEGGNEVTYFGDTERYITPAVKVINFENGNIISLDDNTQKNAKYNCRCVRSLSKPENVRMNDVTIEW